MAHFREADFDQGIGTNTVAADTEEKQTVHCAKRGRGREKTNPEGSLPPALAPLRSVLARLCLKNDAVSRQREIARVAIE